MDDYKNFGKDGSFYHISTDQYEQLVKVKNSETDGLNTRTIRTILEKVKKIKLETGSSFDEVVHPSVSAYDEVQHGHIHETLAFHESDLKHENEALEDHIAAEHQP